MLYISNDTYITSQMVVSVSNYDMPENKRRCKTAKENYKLFDYSKGDKKESVVFLVNGDVYISATPVNELANQLDTEGY